MSENFRPNVCGKYALQGSSRALYTPLDPTHKQCTWPVPFHEVGYAVLIWSGAVKNGSLLGWSDLVVRFDSSGLIWWADFGGLVWRWSGEGVCTWSDLWSGSETHLIVWCDGLIWGGSYGLLLLSGLTAEIKIKKMRSWENSSEKALNALGSYVKKKRRKNTEILHFSNSAAIENFSCPEKVCKHFIILIQGCADDLFESFPYVARIATCNVHRHGNNPGSALIYPRERSRVMQWHNIRWESRFDCKWLVGFYQSNWPFAASHSRGTKPPCWRAKVALGQDKQRKLPFKIMYVFCLSCPNATLALQRGGFVPHEWLAAKALFSRNLAKHNGNYLT